MIVSLTILLVMVTEVHIDSRVVVVDHTDSRTTLVDAVPLILKRRPIRVIYVLLNQGVVNMLLEGALFLDLFAPGYVWCRC